MVTDAIVGAITGFLVWVLSLITVPEPPDFLDDAGGYIATVGGFVANTSMWIPWALIAGVIGAWVVAMGAMIAIKGVRIVASFLTLGGGQ